MGVGLGDGDGDGVGVGVAMGVGLGVAVGVGDGDGEGVGVAVGLGVGVGVVDAEEKAKPVGGVVSEPGAAVNPKLTVPPAGMSLFQSTVAASMTRMPFDWLTTRAFQIELIVRLS
jgi:hypothetical protein